MNKICTSIEQSKRLIELGIDINTADMFWDTLFAKKPEAQVNNHHFIDEYDDEHRVPAWSLSALLELIRNYTTRYEISVYEGGFYIEFEDFITESYFNPLNAAFEMVVLLKEKGLL